jgi:rsbT co-antagonist protein RsbR
VTTVDITESQQEEIRLFWTVYDQHYDTIREQLLSSLREEHPQTAAVLEAVPPEQLDQQAAQNRVLMREVAENSNWEPFIEHLEQQGRQYAEAGLDFPSWFRITRAFRPLVLPYIVEGHGDDAERLLAVLRGMDLFVEIVMSVIGACYIEALEESVGKHQEAIRELSTPVLILREGLLILPVIGVVDSSRARQLTESLLEAIRAHRARAVVIDITGLPQVDTEVANRLVQTAEAARLMGATPIVTGVTASVAKALVTLGINLGGLSTSADLKSGIDEADALLGYRVIDDDASR